MASQFKYYDRLRKKLATAGFKPGGRHFLFPNNGSIANYLFTLFLKHQRSLVEKKDLVQFKIIKPGDSTTNDFIKALREEKFLTWDPDENEKKYNKYFRYLVYSSHELSSLLDLEDGRQKVSRIEFEHLVFEHNKLKDLINNKLLSAIECTLESLGIPCNEVQIRKAKMEFLRRNSMISDSNESEWLDKNTTHLIKKSTKFDEDIQDFDCGE